MWLRLFERISNKLLFLHLSNIFHTLVYNNCYKQVDVEAGLCTLSLSHISSTNSSPVSLKYARILWIETTCKGGRN